MKKSQTFFKHKLNQKVVQTEVEATASEASECSFQKQFLMAKANKDYTSSTSCSKSGQMHLQTYLFELMQEYDEVSKE